MVKLLKLFNHNILFLSIVFLLFFIPVYPKFPLFSVSQTYVSIRIEDILIAFVLGVFIILRFADKDFSSLKTNWGKAILLYFSVGLLSVLSGIFITKNIVTHVAFLHWLRRVEYISLLFVAFYSFKNIKQLKYFFFSVFFATLAVIVYGLGQKYFGWPVVSTMNKEFSKGLILQLTWWARINSTFAGHYDLAAYMVIMIPLFASAMLAVKGWIKKILILFLSVMSYYLLILTASRVSFIAYLVSIVILLFFNKKYLLIVPVLVLSLLGMVFSADLGQRYAATFKINLSFLSGSVKTKEPSLPPIIPTVIPIPTIIVATKPSYVPGTKIIIPTLTPTLTPTPTAAEPYFEPTDLAVGRSTDIRLKAEWPRAINAFIKNPLLGTGFSSITLSTDNDYLRILGETGIIGFVSFVLVFLTILKNFILYIKNKSNSKIGKIIIFGIISSSIGFFLNATFIDVFEASKVAFIFWIMIGVGLKIVDLENYTPSL